MNDEKQETFCNMFESNTFTVIELKEKLKTRRLPTAGTKAELIACLMGTNPMNSRLVEENERDGRCDDTYIEVETREDVL